MVLRYISIFARHRHPVRFVLARLLVLSGLCKFITIPQKGYRIRFHAANLPTNLWIDPTYREEPLSFFNAYLKPGDRVVDVGANVGDTVLTSSVCVGPSGHVTGVEAHPRTYSFLAENVHLNRVNNVTLIHSAAGEQSGTVNFSDSRYDDMNQVNRGLLEVPLNTLDNLVTTTESIALLKIDVEGYELPVFKGARRILSQTKCIYFEVGDKMCRDFDYTPDELLAEVQSHGFSLFIHDDGRKLSELRTNQKFDPYLNMVAVKSSEELRLRTGWEITSS